MVNQQQPYTKTFVCDVTGIKTTYTYNGSSIVNGIIKAEFDYPPGYLEAFNKKEKRQENLPKTKRLYLNPATGNEVSYARAKALRII